MNNIRTLLPTIAKSCRTFFYVLSAGFFLSACGQNEDPVRTLEQEIAAYAEHPSKDAAVAIDVHFDLLDQEIEALESGGHLARAAQLRQERDQLKTQFTAARLAGAINKTKAAIQDMGGALKQVGEEIGSTLGNPTPTPEE